MNGAKTIAMLLAVGMLLSLAGAADAALVGQLGILDLTANGGVNPATGAPWALGDQYRLTFFTSGTSNATSSDISTYNAWVQGLADASTAYDIGAADGATWKVIGSTSAVDARDNTATNPNVETGHAVFLLDGSTVVANDYADLWDGDVQHIIDLTEEGNVETHWPFTGTYRDGTASEDHGASYGALGNPILGGQVGQGQSGNASNWIWRTWTGASATSQLQMYALSDPLAIVSDEPVIIPEPATLAALGLAVAGLGGYVRRRRSI